MSRWLLVFISVCVFWPFASWSATSFPDRYDHEIKKAVSHYWPDYPDWKAWKAQLYQESRLRPDAISPVGAAGLAQFMPATWAQVARELRLPPSTSPHQDIAIQAGAYYMATLRRQWKTPRPEAQRHELAMASYNAGLGNILRHKPGAEAHATGQTSRPASCWLQDGTPPKPPLTSSGSPHGAS